MIVVIKVIVVKVMFLVFCSDDSNSNEKVNKRSTIYGKLVGNGSVMENYAGCSSSCNNCRCQNRRISGRGSRTVRLGWMVTGGKEHDVLPRFGPS